MAILWAGQEDIDFPNGSGIGTSGGERGYRTGYGRMGMYSSCAISGTFSGGAVTSCWLRFYLYQGGLANMLFAGLTRSGKAGGAGLWLMSSPSNGAYLSIITVNEAGTRNVLATSSDGVLSGSLLMDMNIVDYGATATVTGYINGIQRVTFAGDTRISSITDLDRVAFAGADTWCYMSEFIVADVDTRGMSLVTLAPNASGDSKVDWTGDYDAIDELQVSDSDLMYSNVNDAVAQVNLLPTPAGNFAVKAAVISARCSRGLSSTPTKIALGVKTGGSIDAGSDQSLDAAWATKNRIMETNPVTTNAWTTAELDALQLNLKARA